METRSRSTIDELGLQLESEFDFGKFQGETLKEVLEIQPSYLEWCALYVDSFILSEKVIKQIHKIRNDFHFSDEALKVLYMKFRNFEQAFNMNEEYKKCYKAGPEVWGFNSWDDMLDSSILMEDEAP